MAKAKALEAAGAQILRGGWTRRPPRFLNVPFLDVILTAHEIAVIDEQGVEGRGGYATLLMRFQRRVDRETGVLRLTNNDLRRIALYAFGHGDQGGWQARLLEAFQRTLGLKLDGRKISGSSLATARPRVQIQPMSEIDQRVEDALELFTSLLRTFLVFLILKQKVLTMSAELDAKIAALQAAVAMTPRSSNRPSPCCRA